MCVCVCVIDINKASLYRWCVYIIYILYKLYQYRLLLCALTAHLNCGYILKTVPNSCSNLQYIY